MKWRVFFNRQFSNWHIRSNPELIDDSGQDPLRQNVSHPGIEDPVRLRNVRIAAAAPELFEVCEEMLLHIETGAPIAMHKVRAVIGKAQYGGLDEVQPQYFL